MKSRYRNVLLCSFLCSFVTVLAEQTVATYLNFRSPSRNTAAKIVGTTSNKIFLPDRDERYATFFVQPTYKQSFRGKRIAQCLFGDFLVDGTTDENCDEGAQSLKISGSQVANRNNSKDLMAENFYLPRDFESTLNFRPRVRTFSLDFHLYVGLDQCCPGMYFRLYGPYVHSRYDLRFSESEPNTSAVGYQEGFFSSAPLAVSDLLENFTAYARGDALQNIPTAANTTISMNASGLKNAKITCNEQKKNCLGDLRFELGYNMLLEDDRHFGLNLQMAAPTGPKPKGEFLFESQCGNSGLWEFGFGITGHKKIWSCEDDDERYLTFWVEADITHMFGARQLRTFDLKDKPLSRYMLAQQMDKESVGLLASFPPPPPAASPAPATATILRSAAAFNGTYEPVANFSTREVKVSASIQADVTTMFTFNCDCFSWDLGYNFWVRTCEKIKPDNKGCNFFPENTWALKGDAFTVGFQDTANVVGGTIDAPHPLSATQQNATISVGTNQDTATPETNIGIDRPFQAFLVAPADGTTTTPFDALFNFTTGTTGRAATETSIQPILITENDLNFCPGTRGISHKVFTHFNYTFTDCEDWKPYLGIGAEVEFGKATRSESNTSDTDSSSLGKRKTPLSSCMNCALTQWGVWLKAGFSWE